MKRPHLTIEEALELVRNREDPFRAYVFWLLADMWDSGVHFTVLMPSDALPAPPDWDPENVPPYERVKNRLKALTGLDPVIYPDPHRARVELSIDGQAIEYTFVFYDVEPLPRVEITLHPIPSDT